MAQEATHPTEQIENIGPRGPWTTCIYNDDAAIRRRVGVNDYIHIGPFPSNHLAEVAARALNADEVPAAPLPESRGTPIDDGGPAFPHLTHEECRDGVAGVTDPKCPGISLRDYFAAKAMQAIVAKMPAERVEVGNEDGLEKEVSVGAYTYADAMLATRKAGGK